MTSPHTANDLFAGYATRVALSVSLTRPMAVSLRRIRIVELGLGSFGEKDDWKIDNFIASSKSLQARGLVTWTDNPHKKGTVANSRHVHHRVTEPGIHVLALAIIAGVVGALPEKARLRRVA